MLEIIQRYSGVPLKGKNKTLVKILGGRQHRTTPAGQILGGRDPSNPCSVDAYVLGVYIKRSCSRVTSASSALGVLNDYAMR